MVPGEPRSEGGIGQFSDARHAHYDGSYAPNAPRGQSRTIAAGFDSYNFRGNNTNSVSGSSSCLGSSTQISVIRGMSLPKKMKLSELLHMIK